LRAPHSALIPAEAFHLAFDAAFAPAAAAAGLSRRGTKWKLVVAGHGLQLGFPVNKRGAGLADIPGEFRPQLSWQGTVSYYQYTSEAELMEMQALRRGVVQKVVARGRRNAILASTIDERFDETADPQLVKWFIEQAGSNDPAFIARFVLHMCTHDFMDELSVIKVPTLIVAAGKERIGHASAYEEMKKKIAGSELRYYDTSAHNICDGYAPRCVDDLMDFLSTIQRPEARDLIYGFFLAEATGEALRGRESELIDWLAEVWKIDVKIDDGDAH